MKEILLCKYGEIVLKGLNKKNFERLLVRELEKRLKTVGEYAVSHSQSTIYVEPLNGSSVDDGLDICRKVFGIVGVCRACCAEKNMEAIIAAAREYVPQFFGNAKTFRCDARRADKRFPLTSPEIAGEVGAELLECCPSVKVDLNNPDISVMIEIREEYAYIHAGVFAGAGGMPTASNGKALLLLSGGIDSPVAGFMMAKRGVVIDALHFESYPYTSVQAREKVLELAGLVSKYCGKIRVHIVSLTKLQEELRDRCCEDYFTLLLRRSMMRIAERVAEDNYCPAIITGESLGQVASQTMQALTVTDSVVNRPVFRPCIGMDKEEIIAIARRINTFETSILPFEDCCTVFTPRHPKTRPELDKVIAEESRIDFAALENEAYSSLYTVEIDAYGNDA